MSLSSGKTRLLSDWKSTSSTYRLISTIHILAVLQLVVMNVRNNCGGFDNVTLGTGNDGIGV